MLLREKGLWLLNCDKELKNRKCALLLLLRVALVLIRFSRSVKKGPFSLLVYLINDDDVVSFLKIAFFLRQRCQ